MNDKKYLFGALGVVTFFIFIISSLAIYIQENYSVTRSCGCDIPIYLVLIAFASFGLFAGSVTYYFHSKYTDKEKESIGKSVSKTLMFLGEEDRKIVNVLLKYKEGISQSNLRKKTSLDTVKLHRRLKKLENKNIIQREKYGMTYKVYVDSELRDLFE